jgi:DNA-binding TFAR19-related protein (PDSD5 family)
LTYLHRLLAHTVADLNAEGVRFALVGGLAVSVQIEARFTRDLDFAVACLDDQQAESVVAALQHRGYTLETVLEHETRHRLATVRLLPPEADGSAAMIDLLFATAGIEPEVVAEASLTKLPGGVHAPVARIGHLIALKLLASDEALRPQDQVDIANLVRAAEQPEIDRARLAVRLIVERGFHRGRDLEGDLDAWIRRRTPAS